MLAKPFDFSPTKFLCTCRSVPLIIPFVILLSFAYCLLVDFVTKVAEESPLGRTNAHRIRSGWLLWPLSLLGLPVFIFTPSPQPIAEVVTDSQYYCSIATTHTRVVYSYCTFEFLCHTYAVNWTISGIVQMWFSFAHHRHHHRLHVKQLEWVWETKGSESHGLSQSLRFMFTSFVAQAYTRVNYACARPGRGVETSHECTLAHGLWRYLDTRSVFSPVSFWVQEKEGRDQVCTWLSMCKHLEVPHVWLNVQIHNFILHTYVESAWGGASSPVILFVRSRTPFIFRFCRINANG